MRVLEEEEEENEEKNHQLEFSVLDIIDTRNKKVDEAHVDFAGFYLFTGI